MAELTIFNRTELTKRLAAKLKHDEAVPASAIPISIWSPPGAGRRTLTCSMLAVPIARDRQADD